MELTLAVRLLRRGGTSHTLARYFPQRWPHYYLFDSIIYRTQSLNYYDGYYSSFPAQSLHSGDLITSFDNIINSNLLPPRLFKSTSMKSLICIALILALAYADAEACVRQNCPNEVSACEKEVFGCALKALNCNNKCSGDPVCNSKCATDSGNAKLKALNECGKKYCSGVTYFTPLFHGCDAIGCAKQVQSGCLAKNASNLPQCLNAFFETNPECLCLKEL